MEANEEAHGAPGSAEDQGDPSGADDSHGRPVCPRGPRGAGGVGTAAGGAPPVEGILHASAQGGDAEGQADQLLEFILTVPFLSFMEAEVACRSLSAEPFRSEVDKELRVTGSDLIVRLTADDPGVLHMSITTFFNQLSQVVRTMQQIGPPIFAKPLPGEGS